MKTVLYINGEEGLLCFNVALKHSTVVHVVIPKKGNNSEIERLAKLNSIPISYRVPFEKIDFPALEDCVLISSAFPYKIKYEEYKQMQEAVNFHAAILPKYRGRHGGTWAKIYDEKELGVTVHKINEEFDSGEIIAINRFAVKDNDSFITLHEKTLDSLVTLLKQFLQNSMPKSTTLPEKSIYWRLRTPEDSRINWQLDARKIFLFTRALNRPNVYAFTEHQKTKFFIHSTEIIFEENNILPGTVIIRKNQICIVCGGNNSIRVLKYSSKNNSQLLDGMVLH